MSRWGGRSREKSLIKVRQSSKPQAVVADRLWTVHDVSAFLGVPGHAVPVAVPAGRSAGLPGGQAHPVRLGSGPYMAEYPGRLWPMTSSDALTASGEHATATQTIASTRHFSRKRDAEQCLASQEVAIPAGSGRIRPCPRFSSRARAHPICAR